MHQRRLRGHRAPLQQLIDDPRQQKLFRSQRQHLQQLQQQELLICLDLERRKPGCQVLLPLYYQPQQWRLWQEQLPSLNSKRN